MTDFQDPKELEFRGIIPTAPVSTSVASSNTDPEKEANIGRFNSVSSNASVNSDPLSPLERALTPDLETAAEHFAHTQLTYTRTGTSFATNGSRHPSFEIDFVDNDPDDPRNWSLLYRGVTIGAVSFSTWNVVLYSTSYTSTDITNETYRALAFSIWSIGPMNGPITGPLIGGFAAEYLGWRWTNWIVFILSGAGWVICASVKETYAPVILKKKAAKVRKETGDDRYWCRYDEKLSEILKLNLSRPFILTFTEPILWFWDAYIAIIYGILYLCFIGYPIIYTDLRGWSLGITGLAFSGIGLGTMLAIIGEPLIRKIINSHKKDVDTGRVAPEASISVVCIAALLIPIGQLWFSWTSVPVTIHWIWPILGGVPFGMGNTLVFIYASNYIAGSYGIYAASALAGNSVIRSFIGGTLPLAGPTMYSALSPQWAGTLLGIVQVILIPIPFVFYKWGENIRGRSRLIKQMRGDQERNERRAAKVVRQQAKRDIEKGAEVADPTMVNPARTVTTEKN
ncbi:hypothetical protein B7494_g1824 [Chlorociboria aeruginascens]|nr:hypothetical protein B7494_g1824 [Chlorociboria aeruginascens]